MDAQYDKDVEFGSWVDSSTKLPVKFPSNMITKIEGSKKCNA